MGQVECEHVCGHIHAPNHPKKGNGFCVSAPRTLHANNLVDLKDLRETACALSSNQIAAETAHTHKQTIGSDMPKSYTSSKAVIYASRLTLAVKTNHSKPGVSASLEDLKSPVGSECFRKMASAQISNGIIEETAAYERNRC